MADMLFNGNGRQLFISNALTALMSIGGTVFVLWVTVAGHYVSRDEVRQLIRDASDSDWQAMAGTLATVNHGLEMVTQDVRSVLQEIGTIKQEQGRMSGAVNEISKRLR